MKVCGLLLLLSLALGKYIPPGPRYRCPNKPLLIYPCSCTRESDKGISVICENTNLASMSVGLTNLGTFRIPVEDLTINRCNIGRLYGSLLYTLSVRVLTVAATPLLTIEPNTFLGINRTLQELHLIGSRLQVFPTEAFKVLGNLSVLNIAGHEMTALPTNSFGAGLLPNRLERLHITGGSLVQLPVETLAPLRKLKKLFLHGNHIAELKRGQFKGLRDTEVLDLSHNNLSKIDASMIADLNKMGWCNLSHNAIAELSRGTFARNTVLRLLNMSHNKLRKLDANTFRGMRFIRRIYLSDNQIADVGRGTFSSVTRVGTIDLARNLIKKIDYQMFYKLQFVEILDVAENLVTEIQKLAFSDLVQVQINVSHNAISKIEAGAFENCINITVLDLSHNRLQDIPRTAFDSNTYATELIVTFNQLTDLSQVPLQNMTGLKILNASYNLIETIPRNTFPKLYELHTIDLSHNRLNNIWNAVFQTLFSLRQLNLSHNALDSIKSSTMGALHSLLHLDLSHNVIQDVSRGSLARLSSVRTLTLRNNSISKIFQLPISLSHLDLSHNAVEEVKPLETWPVMNSLLSLDLSYNRLGDSLQRNAFKYLLTLQTLDLRGNNLTSPPWESLVDMSTLQYLYLQNNGLTELQRGAFGRLPVVFELNLAHNQISNISTRAFEGLLQLLTLNLSSNNIAHIPNGAFQGLVSLRTLDLSHNRLEKLDNKTHGLLDDCLSLERVNLSHNDISFITRKTFPSSPWVPYKLREIDLSYNAMPVLTYDITVGTKNMEILNVSHNFINEIRRGVLGNLTSLRILDISQNELTNFDPKVFGPPPNLTSLYMAHNHFTRLPLEELNSLTPQLRLVDARENQFAEFPHQLMPLVENGTRIMFSNNPLQCDCLMRPLRRWLSAQIDAPREWQEVTCSQPDFLSGQSVTQVQEDHMVCQATKDSATKTTGDVKFDISPDIKFRDLHRMKSGDISVTWYVTTREDVADFYVVVRDISTPGTSITSPIFEYEAQYISRSHVLKALPERPGGQLELCVLARDSLGNVRKWRKSQCQVLPRGGASYSTAGGVESGSVGLCILLALSVNIWNTVWVIGTVTELD